MIETNIIMYVIMVVGITSVVSVWFGSLAFLMHEDRRVVREWMEKLL